MLLKREIIIADSLISENIQVELFILYSIYLKLS